MESRFRDFCIHQLCVKVAKNRQCCVDCEFGVRFVEQFVRMRQTAIIADIIELIENCSKRRKHILKLVA